MDNKTVILARVVFVVGGATGILIWGLYVVGTLQGVRMAFPFTYAGLDFYISLGPIGVMFLWLAWRARR